MSDAGRTKAEGGIYLRPMADADIGDRYLSWFRDSVVTRYLDAHDITRGDALAFLHWGRETGQRFVYAICEQDTGLHIGNVKIGDIELKTGISDLVTMIGDRGFWGKGIATSAIRLGNALAFERHGIRKLHGGMLAGNIGSVKAYCAAGWVIEAVIHGQHVLNGQPVDRIVVSCFNPKLHPVLPSFPIPLPVL